MSVNHRLKKPPYAPAELREEEAKRAQEARQAAWTAAGHPGTPPNKPIPPLAPDASHRWPEPLAHGGRGPSARDPWETTNASPFTSLATIYTLSDDALLAAINGQPLYAGWAEYDNKQSSI